MDKAKKIVPRSQSFGFVGALFLVIGFIQFFMDFYRLVSFVLLFLGSVFIGVAFVLKFNEIKKK